MSDGEKQFAAALDGLLSASVECRPAWRGTLQTLFKAILDEREAVYTERDALRAELAAANEAREKAKADLASREQDAWRAGYDFAKLHFYDIPLRHSGEMYSLLAGVMKERDALRAEVDEWKENAKYLLNSTAAAVRSCYKGGAENLIESLSITFIKLRDQMPLHADLERLRAEVERLREDAERYRWLRQPDPLSRAAHIAVLTRTGGWVASGDQCDAAIDAARKEA